MSSQVIILQLAILLVVLESDTGLRKIAWFRIARPIITVCAIAPSYLSSLPTSGHDTLFQVLGVVVGAAVGALVVSPLLVTAGFVADYRSHWVRWRHKPGKPAIVSRAGWGYASVWIAICALRLFFAYGSQHIFAHGLATFTADNQLSAQGLTNTLIFFSIAMDLAHSAGLLLRRHSVRRRVGRRALRPAAPTTSPGPTPAHATTEGSPHPGVAALSIGAAVLGWAVDLLGARRVDRDQARAQRRQERLDRRRR